MMRSCLGQASFPLVQLMLSFLLEVFLSSEGVSTLSRELLYSL
jgi:hypothetical protein